MRCDQIACVAGHAPEMERRFKGRYSRKESDWLPKNRRLERCDFGKRLVSGE